MNQETWNAVDEYVEEVLIPEAGELNWVLEANALAGLPAIDVSPAEGKLLMLLIQMCGAETILEIGTLGGYSTIWMSRGLGATGHIVTLELDDHHAAVAHQNFHRAGIRDLIDLRTGPANESLTELARTAERTFDFVFVDADKTSLPQYFQQVLPLTRAGSVIVFDNVIRNGDVIDRNSTDESVIGVRCLNALLQNHPLVDVTAIQTVSRKGYDGFAMAIVRGQAETAGSS